MQTLYNLYLQNPFWIWLAVGAVFVALDIATGTGKLIWPGVAAAALAFINLADVRLGMVLELCLFGVVAAVGVIVTSGFGQRRSHASPDDGVRTDKKYLPTPESLELARQERTAYLIGRIGRTTSEFVNGVGRVWIDGAEWGAEIDAGGEVLPPDEPVRVMGVTGGVRLQVRGLMA